MIDLRLPIEVRQRWIEPRRVVDVTRLPPGMSGAIVFWCQSETGRTYALKAYPQGFSAERLGQIHHVWRSAIDGGCESLPAIDAVLHVEGRCWEASDWINGAAAPPDADISLIERGANLIAEFHHATEPLGTFSIPAPAIASRLDRLRELDRAVPSAMGSAEFSASPPLAQAIGDALTMLALNWHRVSQRLADSLRRYSTVPVPCQYVLRDVHREHILFDGPLPRGIIDLDAVRIDTPWADLARWVGDFLVDRPADGDAIWQAALAGLMQKNVLNRDPGAPSAQDGLRMARVLHEATTWIGLANWVVWVCHERRKFHADDRRVAERILRLTRNAQMLLPATIPSVHGCISLTGQSPQN